VALVGAALVLLTTFAGGSGAGISSYQGTLYFAGPASALPSSYQLTTAAPAAQGTTPSAANGVAGSGGLASGSYRWIYVTSSGGALTASSTSNQLTVGAPGNTPVLVSNVPVGADVYRATIPGGTSTGKYTFVGTNAGPTTTYTDTNTSTAGAALPQADNRVPLSTTGWMAFTPGSSLATSGNSSVSAMTPSIPGSCTGWTVDSSGGFTLPAGTWTFNAQVRPDAAGSGTALLSVAMWKVDTSGNTIAGGTIVPVTDGNAMALNATSQNVSASYTTASAVTLDTNERLCVQFWRHQTVATTAGGATNRTVWMLAHDPNSRISLHPAPNAFASAALSSPADGLHTTSIPALAATYSDAEADAGTLTIRVCSDSGCATPLQNSGAMAATNGATRSWTPSGLADGAYYWEAQAQDATGLPSSWTASRRFDIDNAAPTTTIDSNPPAQSNATSGNFTFSANESVTGFQCRIDGGSYAACSSPHAYGPLADGPHTFDVKAVADLAGNAGTATSYGWTIDTAPPNTSITSNPSALSNSASPSFGFSSTESGSFECSLDGAAFAACTSPKAYSGLADGAHTFQVRGLDPAGNADPTPASYAWTIDATPPNTTIGPSQPAALTTATGATFDFSSTESPSTFQCSRDGAPYTSCTSPKTYSGLADGNHTFDVRATDSAGNVDPTPATYAWTVDTTAPVTSIGPTVPPANTSSSSATFDVASNEGGSSFECRLDGGLYGPCTTPASYTGLADGVHTFDVRATDPAGNLDTSPASYSWTIDNVAPSTPALVAPADALTTNTLPQLRATFDDATPGDTGTVEFRICSSSAPAGTSCAPVVQAATSGSLSSGGTATVTPTALPDGTYHWQARAKDAAGNQPGWSVTRSFQLDTVPPVVTLGEPADGAWVKTAHLTATFSKASFAGTGSVEFRICSDALCLGVLKSAQTGSVLNGALADWSPSSLSDGLYYWQARAHDSAGNVSAWTSARMFTRDSVAPGKPLNFNGVIAEDGLTLRWQSPGGTIANYVVFVNGAPWKNFGSSEFEVKMGPFDEDDARTFAVVAVDPAGNIGTMSAVLVGVPDLVGLTASEAEGAASARGLHLHRPDMLLSPSQMVVSSQDPKAPALREKGSAVNVTLTPTKGAPLAFRVKPGRVSSKSGSILRLRIQLSAPAVVSNRLLNAKGHVVKRGRLGSLRAGTTIVRIKLPGSLQRGAYRLMLDASGVAGTAHALVRVSV
jgi:hypothetical protein